MKKVKKILCLCLATCMLSIGTGVTAFAEESKDMVFGDDYVPQSLVNYGCDFNEDASEKSRTLLSEKADYDIIDMVVSKENIVIESNGGSEFIDVFGKLKDGTYVNITNDVSCKFDDGSIATWIYGRILADAKGKTTMTLTYNGASKNLPVIVEKQIDIEKYLKEQNDKMMKLSQSNVRSTRYPEQYRFDAIEIASDMVNLKWKPEQDLYAWDYLYHKKNNSNPEKYIFKADVEVTGIPYTQSYHQENKSEFIYDLENESDFYNDDYVIFKYGRDINQPYYGNDCSGFVSFCWDISRLNTHGFRQKILNDYYKKVGSYSYTSEYEFPSYNTLYSAYSSLEMGDAVVNSGHTFLIYVNSNSERKVWVYEQTPIKARYACWTYDKMANSKYLPFSKQ